MHDNMYKQKSADESEEQRRNLEILLERIDDSPRANIVQATWDSRTLEEYCENKSKRTGEYLQMVPLNQAIIIQTGMFSESNSQENSQLNLNDRQCSDRCFCARIIPRK